MGGEVRGSCRDDLFISEPGCERDGSQLRAATGQPRGAVGGNPAAGSGHGSDKKGQPSAGLRPRRGAGLPAGVCPPPRAPGPLQERSRAGLRAVTE